jgi:uncharacterized protein (DUF1697 family)
MAKYVALLRAINVGGHNVKMEQLRRLFEDLSLGNVETFIASGNVIFESPRTAAVLEKLIYSHLTASLGYEVHTFLRTPRELQQVAAHRPFATAPDRTLYVGFLPTATTAAETQQVLALRDGTDELAVHGREVYWLPGGLMRDSKFSNAILERALGRRSTFRNISTVTKLAEKYAG